jgi:hypothetical protein
MKFHMTKSLRFWVDAEYEHLKIEFVTSTRAQLLAQILGEFEEAGDAMRYLNSDGRVAWKATPRMLTKLENAEQEVIHDLAEWP